MADREQRRMAHQMSAGVRVDDPPTDVEAAAKAMYTSIAGSAAKTDPWESIPAEWQENWRGHARYVLPALTAARSSVCVDADTETRAINDAFEVMLQEGLPDDFDACRKMVRVVLAAVSSPPEPETAVPRTKLAPDEQAIIDRELERIPERMSAKPDPFELARCEADDASAAAGSPVPEARKTDAV